VGSNMELALTILLYAIPVLISIVIHEYMHAYAADKLGDPIPRREGRLTLNPIAHIDPIGTIIVPLALLIFSNATMVFGWAKPVPISPMHTLNPKRTLGITAVAGPLSNLALATFFALCLKVMVLLIRGGFVNQTLMKPLIIMFVGGLSINVMLFVFNLIPLPPLDGSKVVMSVAPDEITDFYAKIEPYGMFILLGFLMLDRGNYILGSLIGNVLKLFYLFIYGG